MKKLPKYFLIKRDENNPLWAKYIDWLNSKSPTGSVIGDVSNYYGLDSGSTIRSLNSLIDIGHTTLITLEEWDECVNGVKKEEPQGYFTYQNWTL